MVDCVSRVSLDLTLITIDAVKTAQLELMDEIGLGHRRFIAGGFEVADFIVRDVASVFPCLDSVVWVELLESQQRIMGEITRLRAVIENVKQSFPRNQQKEPQ